MSKAVKVNFLDFDTVAVVDYPATDTYPFLTKAVDGFIEAVTFSIGETEYLMYVNEEGKLNGLEPNPLATEMAASNLFPWDYIAGNVVILSGEIDNEGNERGLNSPEIDLLLTSFGVTART